MWEFYDLGVRFDIRMRSDKPSVCVCVCVNQDFD